MGVPLYNEFSALPPQHAAAAAQHPMLAPRPIDPATMGYHSVQAFETVQPAEGPSAVTAPQFFYPAPPTQMPLQPWPAQPQHPQVPSSSTTANYSQMQPQPASSNEDQIKHEELIPHHPQPIIYWSNVQQGQEFVSPSVPPLTGAQQTEQGPDNPLFPQVYHASLTGCTIEDFLLMLSVHSLYTPRKLYSSISSCLAKYHRS